MCIFKPSWVLCKCQVTCLLTVVALQFVTVHCKQDFWQQHLVWLVKHCSRGSAEDSLMSRKRLYKYLHGAETCFAAKHCKSQIHCTAHKLSSSQTRMCVQARCQLGNKYGALMEDCGGLLALAHSLNIQVVGVAFHVGSGATNPQAFADAIAAARQVRPALCSC